MCGSASLTPEQDAASSALYVATENARINKKGALTVAALTFARESVVYGGVDDYEGFKEALASFVTDVNRITS